MSARSIGACLTSRTEENEDNEICSCFCKESWLPSVEVFLMQRKALLALSTFSDAETARRISNQLVSERFAACANILPAVESIYRWKDKIESGNETLVFFKLSEDRQLAFQNKLRSLHPYEVPEIIFVPVSGGLPEYLRWVVENCS
jgi:periplasmic divalent cation tolerance protein